MPPTFIHFNLCLHLFWREEYCVRIYGNKLRESFLILTEYRCFLLRDSSGDLLFKAYPHDLSWLSFPAKTKMMPYEDDYSTMPYCTVSRHNCVTKKRYWHQEIAKAQISGNQNKQVNRSFLFLELRYWTAGQNKLDANMFKFWCFQNNWKSSVISLLLTSNGMLCSN